MKLLLIGKNGQLGFELQRSLQLLGEVVAVGRDECNLADARAIRHVIRVHAPEVIVNAAAFTAVDKAESEPGLAHAVNAVAPGVIGEEARRLSSLVVHYSTDYVFDGLSPEPYSESDVTAPQNTYGRSKLEGENRLQGATPRHLIFRTSWVFGAHGGNFVRTILRLAAERESIKVVHDQVGAPTSAAFLADATAFALRVLNGGGASDLLGLYHLSAAGKTTWNEYARIVVDEARKLGAKLKLAPESIVQIPSSEYPTPARRPANSLLDTGKFRNAFSMRVDDWKVALKPVVQKLVLSQ